MTTTTSRATDTYLPGRPVMTAAELEAHRLSVGFGLGDDGYDRLSASLRAGWRALPSWGRDGWDLGSWPLVVVTMREGHSPETGAAFYELRTDAEGDLTTYRFGPREDFRAAVDYLAAWYWIAEGVAEQMPGLEGATLEGLEAGLVVVPLAYRGPYRAS